MSKHPLIELIEKENKITLEYEGTEEKEKK